MIRRFAIALLLPAVLAVSGCATITTPTPSAVTEVVDEGMERATQALIAAENAYTVAALGVAAAARNGLVPPSAAPEIRRLSRQATSALNAAHSARSAAERYRQINIVEGVTAALNVLRGGQR